MNAENRKLNGGCCGLRLISPFLPECVWRILQSRDSQCELRGTAVFVQAEIRLNVKEMCISVEGETLWDGLNVEMKA